MSTITLNDSKNLWNIIHYNHIGKFTDIQTDVQFQEFINKFKSKSLSKSKSEPDIKLSIHTIRPQHINVKPYKGNKPSIKSPVIKSPAIKSPAIKSPAHVPPAHVPPAHFPPSIEHIDELSDDFQGGTKTKKKNQISKTKTKHQISRTKTVLRKSKKYTQQPQQHKKQTLLDEEKMDTAAILLNKEFYGNMMSDITSAIAEVNQDKNQLIQRSIEDL